MPKIVAKTKQANDDLIKEYLKAQSIKTTNKNNVTIPQTNTGNSRSLTVNNSKDYFNKYFLYIHSY